MSPLLGMKKSVGSHRLSERKRGGRDRGRGRSVVRHQSAKSEAGGAAQAAVGRRAGATADDKGRQARRPAAAECHPPAGTRRDFTPTKKKKKKQSALNLPSA